MEARAASFIFSHFTTSFLDVSRSCYFLPCNLPSTPSHTFDPQSTTVISMVRNTNRKTKIPPPVVAPPVDLRYTVQSSLLLRMAPELKNRVLELVCSDTTIHFSRKMKSGNAPGFLVACKQLHAESILVH